MKVLLIHRWSHLENVGGVQRVFFSMANALSKQYEVTAFAMTQTSDGKPFFELSSRVKFVHKDHCYNGKKSIWHRIVRAFHKKKVQRHRYDQQYIDPIWAKTMCPIIEQEKPDVIIAYRFDVARVLLHTLSVECPVVIMLHQSAQSVLKYLTMEDKQTLERAACVQVLMPSDVSVVEKSAKCRHVVRIPNAVESSGLTSTLMNHKIIHVGRFSKGDKRQHIIIKAFHLLQDDFSDWNIEFWGGTREENSYARECYELVKKYHLEERVKFMGITNDVPAVLLNGAIFAFPSSEEGMPIALVEAMEVGLAVIGFKSCHGVNEVIQDGVNGILCDDGVASFAASMRKLMECEALRKQLGRRAKISVSEYTSETVWQAWENLLRQIVREKE